MSALSPAAGYARVRSRCPEELVYQVGCRAQTPMAAGREHFLAMCQ
jgi:hypothetical protein